MKFLFPLHILLFLLTCPASSQKDTLPVAFDTLNIIGVGDIMMGTDYPSTIYLPPGNDCQPLMKEVYSILQDADITFGNLEGSFAGETGTPKKCKDTTKCFVFRMPEHYVNCLVDAGFDMLSMANNHSNDFGSGGRKETEWILENHGLAYAGSLSTPYTVVVREGVKYGMIAFAPNKGCYSIKEPEQAIRLVKQLQAKCDIVIVSVHGGAEGADYQNTPRTSEIYLGYDRGNIYEFSHMVIDAGADIVFGHGPHVTRAAEVYKDRFIIYSLGNFCTYRRFNLRGPNGIAPIVKLKLADDGRFLGGKIYPVYQAGQGGVSPDPQNRVIYKLRDLTRSDFPETPLKIDDEGRMWPE